MIILLSKACISTKNGWKCRAVPMNMSNQRMHWAVKSKWTNAWKQAVWDELKLFRPTPHYEFAKITATFYSCRLMDYDGAYNAIKPVLDGIKEAGIIVDDSPKYIDLLVRQVKVAHRNEERTVIEVDAANREY